MSFSGRTIANSFKEILKIGSGNTGITTSLQVVKDGAGNQSALYVSDDQIKIQPENDDTTTLVDIKDKDGDTKFVIDSTNDYVKALGHQVNTNIQDFYLVSSALEPSSTDQWTALGVGGGGRTHSAADVYGGTGGTPSTSFTIATTADDMVCHYFYVPFNITIDSVHVWFGANGATGDDVKFSVMSYDVVTTAGSTSGDLSSGVENCASASAIAGAGYEQAYYQSLTVSTANVDSGKIIMGFVAQDGTSSDLSIRLQLVYHLRG